MKGGNKGQKHVNKYSMNVNAQVRDHQRIFYAAQLDTLPLIQKPKSKKATNIGIKTKQLQRDELQRVIRTLDQEDLPSIDKM